MKGVDVAAIDGLYRNSSKRRWSTIILFSLFGIVSLSMVVLIALSLLVPPAMQDMVETYTAVQPAELPHVTLSESEKEAVEARLDKFESALRDDVAVEPLELDAREINGLLPDDDTESTVYLSIRNGSLLAQMSLPLDSDLELGPWRSSMRGRYINGIAELRLMIEGETLEVDLVSFEVKGKPVPGWLRRVLQGEIDNMDWLDSQDVRDVIGRLRRIGLEDDRLVLYPAYVGSKENE